MMRPSQAQLGQGLDIDVPAPAIPQPLGDELPSVAVSAINLLNSYVLIFLAAFMVTLLTTPLVRRMAVASGIIDQPDKARKLHEYPVAYLGGVAVFFGLIVAIGVSYVYAEPDVMHYQPVPIAIVVGMLAIALTGFADDVWGFDPRLKIAGQLVAAAALAIEEVGVKVAAGALKPLFGAENLMILIPTPIGAIPFDVVYWVGTALIAIFVLGGCNATNLIDGLDGLLSGVVAIMAVGLLVISLLMVPLSGPETAASAAASLDGARIVLCLALLGAVLGFLPHNFNPATIFLGDCGSLLLGYVCVVIILTFGDMGQTHLVFAGMIIFAVPIMDTTLAIIRRKLAGTPMSAADDQHIHHQLKRALGGVKRAVLALYGITAIFAAIGVTLAALVIQTGMRVRFIYVIAFVVFSFIGVIAVKAARRQQLMIAAERSAARASGLVGESDRSAPGAARPGTTAPSTDIARSQSKASATSA